MFFKFQSVVGPAVEADVFGQPHQEEDKYVLLTSDDMEERCTTSSQSSQQSVPEAEISILSDEIKEQQMKRQILNNTILTLAERKPVLITAINMH